MSKQIRLPTLLIVADNPSVRFWVKKQLEDQFFLITAQSRQEALEALNAHLDFIIVDAALEEGDALALCLKLSQLTQKKIPILLITGRLKKSFREKALASGVTDFLSDQLDVEELHMRITTGKKTASVREKTEGMSQKIKFSGRSGGSLKSKFVLTDQALRNLANAREKGIPVALLVVRIDKGEEISDYMNRFARGKGLWIPSDEGGALLLFDTPFNAARSIAETLREEAQTLHVTISIAVSSLEASEKGFNRMIDTALKSLKTHSETNLIISVDEP